MLKVFLPKSFNTSHYTMGCVKGKENGGSQLLADEMNQKALEQLAGVKERMLSRNEEWRWGQEFRTRSSRKT